MKRVFFVVARVLSLAGCGQASKAPQVKTDTGVESASAEVKTLQMEDGLKVTWLQDVGRKQARSIFADASDALVDSLGLQDGVPSTISAFLVEKDGVQILFVRFPKGADGFGVLAGGAFCAHLRFERVQRGAELLEGAVDVKMFKCRRRYEQRKADEDRSDRLYHELPSGRRTRKER